MFRLVVFCIFAVLALASGNELHQRQLAGHLLIEDEPLDASRQLAEAGDLDEAALMARFAADTALADAERDAARELAAQIDSARTLERQFRSFVHGMASGEPRDLAGFLGSLSLDLFVIGDLRDLAVQGYRETTAGDGDMLILALSAVGLATTLAPQVDFAPALLKTFRRAGALGERFVKSLSRTARRAVSSGDYARIGRIAEDFGSAARSLGPAPLARVMKHVDEPAELARVSTLAKTDAAAVYGLATLTQGRAVKVFHRTADAGRMAKAARRTSRATKLFAKGFASVPDELLVAALVSSGIIAALVLATLLPRRRRRAIPVLTERRRRTPRMAGNRA